ncbi:MAG: hypothetical protein JNL96_00800 [Planctomycetaceae bacterium]|nr:hypothetical protein [Planctomycetaceae bacterium]
MPIADDFRRRYAANNPLAPPDRRFRLVRKCLHHGVPLPWGEDAATRNLHHFLRQYENAWEPSRKKRLLTDHPQLDLALRLYRGDGRRYRFWIETYLLAGATDSVVAPLLAVPAGAIAWFRAAFFDVESLLEAPLRILRDVIGALDDDGRWRWDEPKLLQALAYRLKLDGLQQWLAVADVEGSAAASSAWLRLRTQLTAEFKLLLRVGGAKSDDKLLPTLTKLFQCRALKRDADEMPLTAHEQAIKAVLEDLPFACGDDAERLLEGTEVGRWDHEAAVLRDHELLRLSAGLPVAGLAELEGLKLPPPRRNVPLGGLGRPVGPGEPPVTQSPKV